MSWDGGYDVVQKIYAVRGSDAGSCGHVYM